MKITFHFNSISQDENISIDSSSTFSSWLIEFYFRRIYSNEIRSNSKSVPPKNILGLHDMFLIAQLIQPTIHFNEFLSALKIKLMKNQSTNEFLIKFNSYLTRCGLTDLIDLFNEFPIEKFLQSLTLSNEQIHDELDRILIEELFRIAIEYSPNDDEFRKYFDRDLLPVEPTTSKNYIRHTFCMYFSLLLDTRNEHALVHCLITPARQGLERRTIVELRRLSQLKKNESLTMYQILLSFLRRKDLSLNRTDLSPTDETFVILDKYYLGVKEFFDFLEQLQTKIEENESTKVESSVTFRQLLMMISKQLRKDHSFHRCDLLIKEVIDEFCSTFEMTGFFNTCSSPKRSASSGGTLAGRRFLRSLAFICAQKSIGLPVLITKNDHYESPSTGLKKATAARLLRSPLTPIPMTIEPIEEKIEEKPVEIRVESVFTWQKKTLPRRKSQRCLDLSTIDETSCDLSGELTNTRQSLGEISSNSLEKEFRSSPPILSSVDEENLVKKKRSIDSPKKIVKKIKTKSLPSGQKSIKSFFK